MKEITIDERRFLGAGLECHVYAYKKNLVVKIFETKLARDNAWKRQVAAYRAKIAPKTFEKVKILNVYLYRYGYISEKVKTGFMPCDRTVSKMRKTMSTIFKRGNCHFDLHRSNIGKKGNKYVCIDFGDVSIERD